MPQKEIEKIKTKYNIPYAKYLIFVGTIQPRKNIETLLEGFEILRRNGKYEDLGLVIAGSPGWLAENIVREIKKTPGAITTGKFETVDLPALLRGAEIFVLPSLYEGFGLPVLEAMACGTPVALADNSSLREVAEGAGFFFDSRSSEKMAKKLLEIIGNDKLRDDLRKRGLERVKKFSWEKCAKETLEWLIG